MGQKVGQEFDYFAKKKEILTSCHNIARVAKPLTRKVRAQMKKNKII
jgi:hypothetical protein